jgi:hypothetical protein
MSAITQLPETTVNQILNFTARAIGHHMRQEHQQVVLDLGLSTSEVILFDRDQCVFVDKSKLRDSILIN